MNSRILPEKLHVLSGSALKMIAVVCMLIDHVAACLLVNNPIPLFTLFGRSITVYALMRLIGRIAFPIYAVLIVEGYRYTHSRLRYGIGLLVFAVLSEVPWDLLHFHTAWKFSSQNVFFTLLLGYLAICAYDGLRTKRLLQIGAVAAALVVSLFLHSDYGLTGVCFILLMYALRDHELLRDAIGIGVLSSKWKAGLAFLPLALYNGKRGFIKGRVWKYAFYAFYPLHLLALYFLKLHFNLF